MEPTMAAAINTHVSRARWDGILVLLAFAHGALLLTSASIALIAILLWWNANTISHNFIHRPFFRSRAVNLTFSLLLTLEPGSQNLPRSVVPLLSKTRSACAGMPPLS